MDDDERKSTERVTKSTQDYCSTTFPRVFESLSTDLILYMSCMSVTEFPYSLHLTGWVTSSLSPVGNPLSLLIPSHSHSWCLPIWLSDWLSFSPISHYTGSKYSLLPNGDLLIKSVESSDAFKGYRCKVQNKLTGESITSINSGKVIVTGMHFHSLLTTRHIQHLYTLEHHCISLCVCISLQVSFTLVDLLSTMIHFPSTLSLYDPLWHESFLLLRKNTLHFAHSFTSPSAMNLSFSLSPWVSSNMMTVVESEKWRSKRKERQMRRWHLSVVHHLFSPITNFLLLFLTSYWYLLTFLSPFLSRAATKYGSKNHRIPNISVRLRRGNFIPSLPISRVPLTNILMVSLDNSIFVYFTVFGWIHWIFS